MHVETPRTAAEFERYFTLRWEVLRAPWGEPPGSERDEREDSADHAVIWDESGAPLAVGRLHMNSEVEAQIRYMAVAPVAQRRGLGRLIVERLEEAARVRGARYVDLNARDSAAGFYERLGYRTVGQAPTFMAIPHVRMRKRLEDEVTVEKP